MNKRGVVTAISVVIILIIVSIFSILLYKDKMKDKDEYQLIINQELNSFKGVHQCKIILYTVPYSEYLKYLYDALYSYYPQCSIDITTEPPSLQEILASDMFICDNKLNVKVLRTLADKTYKNTFIVSSSRCFGFLKNDTVSKKNLLLQYKVIFKETINLDPKDVVTFRPFNPSVYVKGFDDSYPIFSSMDIDEYFCEEREEYYFIYMKYGLPPDTKKRAFMCKTGNFLLIGTSLSELFNNGVKFAPIFMKRIK